MIVVLVLAVIGVMVVLRWRRQRRTTLAGLNGDRPQFMVEPPRRSVGNRRTELL